MNTPFEKRVCLTICICQLTAVLSCVSIVYLTVAVYIPSYRTLNSGFTEDPVMCTTVTNTTVNCEEQGQPSWSSCGEWCLSKSSGTCTQIRVDVRTNGTNIKLEECTGEEVIWCDGIDPKKQSAECIMGSCAGLTGLFNCSTAPTSVVTEAAVGARCRDLTDVLACNLTSVDPEVHCNTKKSCLHLKGLYLCKVGHCARVRPPFKCEKKCTGIQTGGKSVIIREGDIIFTASCKRAVHMETNEEIWPKNLQSDTNPEEPPTLLMFCTNVLDKQQNKTTIRLSDCFNGTLLEPGFFGQTTDITHLMSTHQQNTRLLDPTSHFAPPESNLLIYNNTRLYINYEACVNTLILNECEKFHAEYGGDGTDLRTQSRFQCFHRPNFTDTALNFVVLRFSRMRTLMELMLASAVPITLAIVSCFILILCTRIIHVGDDSHFYFQCCGNEQKAALEKEAVEAMAL